MSIQEFIANRRIPEPGFISPHYRCIINIDRKYI